MRYGIVEEDLNVICVGCEKVLSEDGSIPYNFCPECGNPLTLNAIKLTEKKQREIQKQVFVDLKEISDNEKLDSFKKVVKKYFEEK